MNISDFFDNLTKYMVEAVILYILISILILLIFIFIFWLIIKSAVKSGVKDAIKETLVETGTAEQLRQERLVYYQDFQQYNNIPQ